MELLITIAIAAILVAVAVPSFKNSLLRNSVEAKQRALQSDLSLARTEAVSRGKTVAVCGSDDGTSCSSSSDWSSGWIAFVDDGSGTGATAGDGDRDGDEEIIRFHGDASDNAINLKDSGGSTQNVLAFNPRGHLLLVSGGTLSQPSDRLTLTVCEPGDNLNFARAVMVDITGRTGATVDTTGDGVYEDAAGSALTCS